MVDLRTDLFHEPDSSGQVTFKLHDGQKILQNGGNNSGQLTVRFIYFCCFCR